MADELKVTQASASTDIDVKLERKAFEAWWRSWCPGREVPSAFSHIFDAWLASARHRIATETRVQATIDELVAGLAAIVDGEIERPLGKRWREDKKPSKNDTCIHGAWMYECCEGCIDAHVLAILSRHKGEGE